MEALKRGSDKKNKDRGEGGGPDSLPPDCGPTDGTGHRPKRRKRTTHSPEINEQLEGHRSIEQREASKWEHVSKVRTEKRPGVFGGVQSSKSKVGGMGR